MRRRLLISALACTLGALVMWVTMGAHAALETLALLLGVCAFALAAVPVIRARARARSISRQLALAVGVAVGAILAAVGLAASLMFISGEDALVVSVMAAVIAVVGVCVAGLITDPIARDIAALRDRLREVGLGSRRAGLSAPSADELSDLAAAANSMIEQLAHEEAARAAADQSRRGVITALSHDLRTPLTALQVLAEAVQDRIATGATRERYLREMQVHVVALSDLIDELFEHSREEAHALEPARERLEVGELVSETVAALQATAERRSVTMRAEPPAGQAHGPLLVAQANASQIRRVLLNLLDNAIRHTPPGGNVRARTSRSAEMIIVEIADDGAGIPPQDIDKVFEAFYRGAGREADAGNGAGLGLAIARAIVDAYDGEIWIEPSERGATVCFSLPALAEHRADPTRVEQPALGSRGRAR
jgi:signal transduction histidine kinase